MFDIELAKLPPPKPARAATNSMTPNGVSGLETQMASAIAGIRSSSRRDDRPVAAAEARHQERVGDPQGGADEARHRDEPEDLRRAEGEAGGGQLDDDDGPELPDDEAEELGEDRPAEVAARDGAALGLPLVLVLGVPVGDPAAGTDLKGGCVGSGQRKRSRFRASARRQDRGNCRCRILRGGQQSRCTSLGDVVLPR